MNQNNYSILQQIWRKKMPPKGWTTITVPQSVYDYFWEKWQEKKEEYRIKYGITSFSGFATKLLSEMLDEYEAREKTRKTRKTR